MSNPLKFADVNSHCEYVLYAEQNYTKNYTKNYISQEIPLEEKLPGKPLILAQIIEMNS